MKEPIIGSKVILREMRDEDAEFFVHWFNDPRVMFRCGFHEPTTMEHELKAIHAKETDRDWYAVTELSGRQDCCECGRIGFTQT